MPAKLQRGKFAYPPIQVKRKLSTEIQVGKGVLETQILPYIKSIVKTLARKEGT
jgi:hypothetical protein